MIVAWMGYAFVVGTLLALTAWTLDRACRLVALPTRWVWLGALALTLVLPALVPLLSARREAERQASFVVLPTRATTSDTPAGSSPLLATLERAGALVGIAARAVRQAVMYPVRSTLMFAEGRASGTAGEWMGAAWMGASACALLLLIAVYDRYRRARQRWPRVAMHGVPVRLAPRTGPVVMGLAHPEIVVPHWLLQRSAEEQRLTLAHEQEHVRARDPLLLAAGCIATAFLPWHPAVWWMCARLRLAVELDCDARVLRAGVATHRYGAVLVELAGRTHGVRAAVPALTDSSSHLERRLLAMTRSRPRLAVLRGTALATCALGALLLACDADMPTAAQVNAMDVVAAERAMTAAQGNAMLQDTTVQYFVDGVQVSAAEAHALAPGAIVRIDVRKSAGANGEKVVDITTVAGMRDGANGVRPLADSGLLLREWVRGDVQQRIAGQSARTHVDNRAAGNNAASNGEWMFVADSLEMRPTADGYVVDAPGGGTFRMEGNIHVHMVPSTMNGTSHTDTLSRPVTMKMREKVPFERLNHINTTVPTRASGSLSTDTVRVPLIYIDGILENATGNATSTRALLKGIDPTTIESVDVIKGPAAKLISSDPRAENGIVRITTKHAP
ncbi:MAG TPA: M56 family metallopeptidase [Gemmatimonadaceae bacterium]|nr:M56 family metallopeptidase [Gemmatimonadaceae bacterium]